MRCAEVVMNVTLMLGGPRRAQAEGACEFKPLDFSLVECWCGTSDS